MVSQQPAHTNQYFSGLKEASIRHESLYIEKKPFYSMIDCLTLYIYKHDYVPVVLTSVGG
jgi:hypothetical protein